MVPEFCGVLGTSVVWSLCILFPRVTLPPLHMQRCSSSMRVSRAEIIFRCSERPSAMHARCHAKCHPFTPRPLRARRLMIFQLDVRPLEQRQGPRNTAKNNISKYRILNRCHPVNGTDDPPGKIPAGCCTWPLFSFRVGPPPRQTLNWSVFPPVGVLDHKWLGQVLDWGWARSYFLAPHASLVRTARGLETR